MGMDGMHGFKYSSRQYARVTRRVRSECDGKYDTIGYVRYDADTPRRSPRRRPPGQPGGAARRAQRGARGAAAPALPCGSRVPGLVRGKIDYKIVREALPIHGANTKYLSTNSLSLTEMSPSGRLVHCRCSHTI